MKGSFKLRSRRALNRSEAWACLTANLALPGSGSLAAGRAVGYGQVAAALLSTGLSIIAAVPFIQWMLSGGANASPGMDPMQPLADLWHHVRWFLLCMCLFAASILWALATSLTILLNAPKESVPPRIGS